MTIIHSALFWLRKDLSAGELAHFEQELRKLADLPYLAQGHVGPAGGSTGDGRDARGVVTGKAHVAGQCGFVHLHLMALGLQTLHTSAKGRFVAHCAGGRKNVNVGHLKTFRNTRKCRMPLGAFRLGPARQSPGPGPVAFVRIRRIPPCGWQRCGCLHS